MKAPSRHVHLSGAKVLLSRLKKYITPSTEYQREIIVGGPDTQGPAVTENG